MQRPGPARQLGILAGPIASVPGAVDQVVALRWCPLVPFRSNAGQGLSYRGSPNSRSSFQEDDVWRSSAAVGEAQSGTLTCGAYDGLRQARLDRGAFFRRQGPAA